jgi:hypothetical protein
MQRTHSQDTHRRDDTDELERPDPTPNFLSAREFTVRAPSRSGAGTPADGAKPKGRTVKAKEDTDDPDENDGLRA